jgi:hypothetical protein
MKLIITESRIEQILQKSLSIVFKGFEDIRWSWADFNCGWGVCCDIYAVGFTLPDSEHDDYIFKLVDGKYYDDDGDYPEELKGELPEECYNQPDLYDPRFDTIVFYEEYAEELETYFGPLYKVRTQLLVILNEMFGMDAKEIIFL